MYRFLAFHFRRKEPENCPFSENNFVQTPQQVKSVLCLNLFKPPLYKQFDFIKVN